jgi:hypothetical protein
MASALKRAFAACETESVVADKETLSPEDFGKILDLLKFRPMHFGLFLKALVGRRGDAADDGPGYRSGETVGCAFLSSRPSSTVTVSHNSVKKPVENLLFIYPKPSFL